MSDPDNNNKLYDLGALEQAFGNNRPFIKHMLNIFIRENSQAAADMKEALSAGNIAVLKAIAHRIKPSINHLHMHQTLTDLRTIEAWEGNHTDLRAIVERVSRSIMEVVEDLKRSIS